MNLHPMSKLETLTRGEMLAVCKLVQMVTHHEEYEKITPETWKRYMMTAFEMDDLAASVLIQKVRRIANRMLKDAN